MVRSEGEAAVQHSNAMGRYTLCNNIITHDDKPVYKHDARELFLYSSKNGNWSVGEVAGHSTSYLYQLSQRALSPHKTIIWKYAQNKVFKDDGTLKVRPCY